MNIITNSNEIMSSEDCSACAACERLFAEAIKRSSPPDRTFFVVQEIRDNQQSWHVARFLMLWAESRWNKFEKFELKKCDGCECEKGIIDDMEIVFNYVSRNPARCPDSLGFEEEYRSLTDHWS